MTVRVRLIVEPLVGDRGDNIKMIVTVRLIVEPLVGDRGDNIKMSVTLKLIGSGSRFLQ
jgi:hypothetical protein